MLDIEIESTKCEDTIKISPLDELTYVSQSKISGMGLYAKKLIPKGTVWWSYTTENTMLISRMQFLTLINSEQSEPTRKFLDLITTYSYYVSPLDSLVFCLDNARFVNHSDTPNSGFELEDHENHSVALRDILPGEEITEDYNRYDPCEWADLCEDFLKHPDNMKYRK